MYRRTIVRLYQKKIMQNFLKRYIKGDMTIWTIFLFLCIISVIENYSAGSFFVSNKANYTSELLRHSGFLIAGVLLAFAVHKMPFKWVRPLAYLLLPIAAFLLLILAVIPQGLIPQLNVGGITLLGIAVENEAARWIVIMGVKFQPSEIAKIAMIIYIADLLSCDPKKSFLLTTIAKIRKIELDERNAKRLKFWSSVSIIGIFFLLIAPDNLSTALLLAFVGFILVFISNVSFVRLAIVVGVGFLLVFGSYFLVKNTSKESLDVVGMGRAKTWEIRVNHFLGENDTSKYDYNDKSAQIVHAQIAVARGGLVGVFPGNSVQRDYLPQAYADFIYAIIIEEIGLFGGVFIMLLYLWFFYRTGMLARKSKYDFPAMLVLGLGSMIVLQAFISIAVAVHLGPVTGQPLPLLSRGGTSVVITWLYIGIIQCVARSIDAANQKHTAVQAENYETPYDLDESEDEMMEIAENT